jgi:hypothetical protein
MEEVLTNFKLIEEVADNSWQVFARPSTLGKLRCPICFLVPALQRIALGGASRLSGSPATLRIEAQR